MHNQRALKMIKIVLIQIFTYTCGCGPLKEKPQVYEERMINPILFSSLHLMITRVNVKFQPNPISSIRKIVEQSDKQTNDDDDEAK